eukprot:3376967-Lingulodinium_polyedra.AAC.1
MDRVVANVRSFLPEDLREAWGRLNGGGKGGSEGGDQGSGKGQGSDVGQAREEERVAMWIAQHGARHGLRPPDLHERARAMGMEVYASLLGLRPVQLYDAQFRPLHPHATPYWG